MPSFDPRGASADARDLEQRLGRAERLLALNERLVAGLIHDLRTPLMAINLSAKVALTRGQEEAVRQAAQRIWTSSERMSRIFDHLLNLSRVSGRVPEIDFQAADLNEPIDAVLAEMSRSAPEANFAVSREGELDGVFDAELLRRTIAHVVATSLPHAGEAQTVTIHLDGNHRDRLWIRISVPCAIPADVQERMFVPQPPVPGLEASGLGLGLHEIDTLVRAHGGSIVGHSHQPIGTVFELLLPRDASGSTWKPEPELDPR